ncbi:hypothetical protein ATO7_06235 [Oceanococcus atlanticus]|uniref:Uncharacterized protein n=1 Tax=Oceanococcus atlanticus TaxID=1317117 RepID=A0A1Y1SII6_9GAMM|nr:hypothetical protein [Oceanococcus atlanticus]ORE89456.1 hypothetical protein ATO7_06235 [Oceanococcus atlanticus]
MNKLAAVWGLYLLVQIWPAEARTLWVLGGRHHEAMTFDAMHCADSAQSAPAACVPRPEGWDVALDLSSVGLGVWSERAARNAVRWPDDPASELSLGNPMGFVRWSWNLVLGGCGGKGSTLTTGLRCSSHYGNLQYLHAMSASKGDRAEDTKEKMLAWTKYLLLVLQDAPQAGGGTFIEQNHCTYWASEQRQGNPIAEDMMPDGPTGFPCVVDKGEPWIVASLFAFYCTYNIYTCDVNLSEQTVKSRALGAILHLIQDSFTQGHALRGDCCMGVEDADLAAYQCAPIQQFNVYGLQNKGRHKAADKEPVAGESCRTVDMVHDPITSAARILWELKTRGVTDGAIDTVLDYVDTDILRLVEAPTPGDAGSGF